MKIHCTTDLSGAQQNLLIYNRFRQGARLPTVQFFPSETMPAATDPSSRLSDADVSPKLPFCANMEQGLHKFTHGEVRL